jgi:hypothetical protein
MTPRGTRLTAALLLSAALALAAASEAVSQEPRLEGRVAQPTRGQIDSILDAARAAGLPTEALVDRALEGASKGARADLILVAVARLSGELATARDALGIESSDAEIVAGASALRAGARPEDLARLRGLRAEQPLTVAAAVLADLVAVGVPTDTAVAAVLTLAAGAEDVEYIAFRRNVERDIALGASPVTALGVRLGAAAAEADFTDQAPASTPTTRRPRKP